MLRDKIEELSLHQSENRACRNVSSLSEKSGLLEKRRVFFLPKMHHLSLHERVYERSGFAFLKKRKKKRKEKK